MDRAGADRRTGGDPVTELSVNRPDPPPAPAMCQSCASAVTGFCSASALNGFAATAIQPAAPAASIASGSAGNIQAAPRRNHVRPSTITTPEFARAGIGQQGDAGLDRHLLRVARQGGEVGGGLRRLEHAGAKPLDGGVPRPAQVGQEVGMARRWRHTLTDRIIDQHEACEFRIPRLVQPGQRIQHPERPARDDHPPRGPSRPIRSPMSRPRRPGS